MREAIAICKGSTVADVGAVVEHHGPVVPIESPVMPSPAKAAEEANSKTNTEREIWAAEPDSWIWIPSWPRYNRAAVNQPGIVTRNINDIWISRFNDNRLSLRRYGLLGRGFQIAGV